MLTAEQLLAAQKANVETLFGLTAKAFEGVEKLIELNVTASKAALAEADPAAPVELEPVAEVELAPEAAAWRLPSVPRPTARKSRSSSVTRHGKPGLLSAVIRITCSAASAGSERP